VVVAGGARDVRVEQAFAAVPREPFAGPTPWFIRSSTWFGGFDRPPYVEAPDADPAFLYQDVLIALDRARGINIGQPSLHAHLLDAIALTEGETVLQVGAGSGYYTAILAHLVGSAGRVHAFEIDPGLAARAERNLADRPWVTVEARSGIAENLPPADIIYVNAGITQPSWSWLDALRPGGRLLFPLTPEGGFGAMLLVHKPREGGTAWPARFVTRAGFIACQARQDSETGRRLTAAFEQGNWREVRSLRLTAKPDMTCWFRGDDWWLSTAPTGPQAPIVVA
jgi:protein-L-isoaspartate(D-aspartate) O-methyltransferase